MSQQDKKVFYVLDELSPRNIRGWIKLYNGIADYCWDHFSYLSHKRSKMYEELKNALCSNTRDYEFSNWRRIIDNQFVNEPLSAKGSVLHFPGGRFNIGDIDPIRFPLFAGLYLAEDTATALREKLGLDPNANVDGLTAEEINVAGNISHFIVKGSLTSVLDITDSKALKDFFKLISGIHLPVDFIRRAAHLKISPMKPVMNVEELRSTFLRTDWNIMPMQFDVPANPQILGQLAHAAGIEGILYPSVKNKKRCLVVYPENFKDSDAYVELEGKVSKLITNTRIDQHTYLNYI